MVLSVAAAGRLGWTLNSPLTVRKVQQLLAMQEKMNSSELNRTTRAQSKVSKFTEQELAIAKEVAEVSLWDFKKFTRSGDVEFLLAQARLREQATPWELASDAIVRSVYPDGARGAFTLLPRGMKLLPVLGSRLTTMRQMCTTISVDSKDPLYLVGIGPLAYMFGMARFILSFHLVAMTEKSLLSFYKCFFAKSLEHRHSKLPFHKDLYGILAIHPLSAPDDQRDLQFVHKLVRTFDVFYQKPSLQSWSDQIFRFTSPNHADKTYRRDLMSGVHYTPFTNDSPECQNKLSIGPVCFLPSVVSDAPATSSIETNKEVTHVVKENKQLAEAHPVRIHQDLIGQLLVDPISNLPTAAGSRIGLLMYHPDHQTPTDSSDTSSYAFLQELCARFDQPRVAIQFPSTPHVTLLIQMEPAGPDQISMKQKPQGLASRGWLLGGVVAAGLQKNNNDASLTDTLLQMFSSELFAQHVRPVVQLPKVSAICILLNPDQTAGHPISIVHYVVPSNWLLPAVDDSRQDWDQCRTDCEPWYSVAPLEEHPDFNATEAAASYATEASAAPVPLQLQP